MINMTESNEYNENNNNDYHGKQTESSISNNQANSARLSPAKNHIIESPKSSNPRRLSVAPNIRPERRRRTTATMLDFFKKNLEVTANKKEKESSNSILLSKASNHTSVENHQEEENDSVHSIKSITPKRKSTEMWTNTLRSLRGYVAFKKMMNNYQLVGDVKLYTQSNMKDYFEKLAYSHNEENEKEVSEKPVLNFWNAIPVLKPDSFVIEIWNIMVSFLMLYTAFITPFRIAFIEEDNDDIWTIIENVMDFLFMTDVFVNLNLAYKDEHDVLVVDRKIIFLSYLKGWLIFDIATSIPQNMIISTKGIIIIQKSDILRIARLAKLNRLIKVFRFIKITRFFRKFKLIDNIYDFIQVNYGISRLILFIFILFICVHITGCLWYFLPKLYDEDDFWAIYLGIQDESSLRKYTISLYWSFTTIFTVGFGDIHAYNNIEFILSIIWMVFGVIFFSVLIGTLSSIFESSSSREAKLNSQLLALDHFSEATNLSKVLKNKIRRIIEYDKIKSFNHDGKVQLFSELPGTLKVEVSIMY